MKTKPWSFCLLVLFIFSFVPLCRAGQTENVLRFGVHVSAMGHLDPHFAAASQDRAFADMAFNGLLRYVPGNAPRIEPDLAAAIPEFRMMNGSQVWTVLLRKGVLFHPGPGLSAHELTAEDVIFSLEKSADEKRSACAGNYTGMKMKKLDDYRLEIILEKPLSSILFFPKLTNYGGGFILSKQAMETLGHEGFKAHPIGTGPFAFKSYTPGSKLELTAHGVGEAGILHLNTRMKPLDDPRVRKAIAYALNRDGFLAATSPRVSGPVFSPVPDLFLPGGLSEKEAGLLKLDYHQDLDKSRQLLAEAGYAQGFTLDLVTSEKRVFQNYYTVLKEQLAPVRIVCNVKTLPHADMHKTIRNHPQAMVIYGASRPNADALLTQFFHSNAIIVTGSRPDLNFSHYDKIDKLIEGARMEINPTAQVNLWVQAQIRILNDMAAFPIMYTLQCYARKNNVDYGHDLVSTMALYPQFTEKTRLIQKN